MPAFSIATPGSTSASSTTPESHSGQKRRGIGLPVSPGLVKVFSVPVTFSAGAGTGDHRRERGAGEALAVGAVAHADEDRLASALWHTFRHRQPPSMRAMTCPPVHPAEDCRRA